MSDYEKILEKGIRAAEHGSFEEALILFSQAAEQIRRPILDSYRAYCQANTDRQLKVAAKVCQESIARESHNSVHHLLLGRIFLLAGERPKAIKSFRMGLKASPNPLIIQELKRLGLRKEPILRTLNRSHPLNYLLGKTFSKLGLR